MQNFKPKKKLIMTCVFECFQSHCHILKDLHESLCMMGTIIIFGENGFIFNFLGLVTWGWVHIQGGVEKIKCQKINVIFFYKQIRMNRLI